MRKLLSSERGIALPLAAGVLLTLSLLIVAVVNTSMQSTNSANTDRNSKRALAAAEAGLQTAANRLNLTPRGPGNSSSNRCLTDTWVVATGGECPGHTMEIGNDARFTYWVTPELRGTDRDCAADVRCAERVITSTGEVNGETRRLQMRLESQPRGVPYFPVAGVFGDSSVSFFNNTIVTGSVGSDGRISANNASTATKLEPLLGGVPPAWVGSPPPPVVPHPTAIDLPPVPIEGTEKNENNVNELIPTNGRVHFDAGRRDLSVDSGQAVLVLPPGDYNLCRFSANSDMTIQVLGPVRIFIDNASRPGVSNGDRCPAGGTWGTFQSYNNIRINPPPSPVVNFQLFVYGGGDIRFHNNLTFNGSIFAPDSLFEVNNNMVGTGAIAVNEAIFKNNTTFTWHDGFADTGGSTGAFERERWVECRPKPANAGDPESGC